MSKKEDASKDFFLDLFIDKTGFSVSDNPTLD